ncbi:MULTISPECIES: N-acetylmuramoyl-L-alanine amidase [Bacillus cereus group]|uniref:Sporulation protein n=1 Tax=Bacillus cereus TaxID=1396 RepID=A0AA44TG99_BACCE|nr:MULTISPECIES: N-acetylmuramoyl-L-alanine amidase [Bacillus cereus group]PFA23008.1 sporulation protein [Bacillus cereus]PFN04329.1 sporulation protein [Bacillus cereus]PFO80623.1 sporulation protein [Bacillus cereus]PFR21007.1 sporulation protein [Bacillus cereus]PFS01756.1 sporulation protein [Bacillus cereus]
MKLVIDAGHGGYDSGAVGNGLVEKNLTLQIAKRVRDILLATYTINIKMTRDSDVFISLSERANIANSFGADFFISFHINSGGGTGFESYIYNGLSDSSSAAAKQKKMHAAVNPVLTKYGLRDRGAKKANYAVLRETAMDSLLTETAFIDTTFDANLLKNPQFIEDLCQAYARGIAEILGLTANPNPSNPNPSNPPPQKLGVAYIRGKNVNLRRGPSTSSSVIRQLNSPESYVVYQENNGWLDLGAGQWIYNDPSYIDYVKYGNSDGSPIGVANIRGKNVNLRRGPSTSSSVMRQLNSPESYLVYAYQNGWLNLGGNQWIYNDPSYIDYNQY